MIMMSEKCKGWHLGGVKTVMYNTRCLHFVSSLVVLMIKRDAQALVFSFQVSKVITNQGEQSEFFSTDQRTQWLLKI